MEAEWERNFAPQLLGKSSSQPLEALSGWEDGLSGSLPGVVGWDDLGTLCGSLRILPCRTLDCALLEAVSKCVQSVTQTLARLGTSDCCRVR